MALTALKAENISFCHDSSNQWHLGPLSLDFLSGQLVGLIGPNGSGKSTLLSILARARTATGSISIFGQNSKHFNSKKWAQKVAYLPQSINVQYDFTVHESVAFGRFPYSGIAGILNEKDIAIIERSLEETDLVDMRHRLISELSGGERQRVFLAAILAQEPAIIFLDEPTTALDIHHQAEFLNIIQKFCQRGMTVIMATHELTMAAHFCDKLMLISQGQIVKHGSPQEVIEQDLLRKVYGKQIKVVYPDGSNLPVVIPDFD